MLWTVRDRVVARLCAVLIDVTNHRICCRIPAWTMHVGQRWRTYDEAPWNLYNLIWRLGQWVGAREEARPVD